MLDPRDISSLHINLLGEDVTPAINEFEFLSYSNRIMVRSICVSALYALPNWYLCAC